MSYLNENNDFIFYLWVDRDTSVIILSRVAPDSLVNIGCFGKYIFWFPFDDTTSIISISYFNATNKSYNCIFGFTYGALSTPWLSFAFFDGGLFEYSFK